MTQRLKAFAGRALLLYCISLLLLFISTAHGFKEEENASLCSVLQAWVQDVPSVDGLKIHNLSNVSWVQENIRTRCASNKSVAFTTDWKADVIETTFLPESAVPSGYIQLSINANVSTNGKVQINITINFMIHLKGKLDAAHNIDTNVTGSLHKLGRDVPFVVNGATSLIPTWKGSLESLPVGVIRIRDLNLFDGAVPSVILCGHSSCKDTSGYNVYQYPLLLADTFLSTAAAVHVRLGPLSATPSSLYETSIRQLFLSPLDLPFTADSNPLFGQLWNAQKNTFDKADGALIQMNASCYASTCGSVLKTILESILLKAVTKDNTSPSICAKGLLLTDTIASHLSVDLFITNSTVLLKGFTADTMAMYQCPSSGIIGMRVSVKASPEDVTTWPLDVYLTDTMAAIGLLHSVDLIPSGVISGSLITTTDNKPIMHSFLQADLFSGKRGGILLPDSSLPVDAAQRVTTLFSQMRTMLSTSTNLLNNAIETLFPVNAANVIQRYQATTLMPSWIGFFQWYIESQSPALSMEMTSDGNITLWVNLGLHSPLSVPYAKIVAGNIDTLVSNLGRAVQTDFQDAKPFKIPRFVDAINDRVSAQVPSAFLRAGIYVSGLSKGTFSAKIYSPVTAVARLSVSLHFNDTSNFLFTCANVSYDLLSFKRNDANSVIGCMTSKLVSKVGDKVSLDRSGHLLVNTEWKANTSQMIPFINSVADVIAQTEWATHLEPLAFDAGMLGSIYLSEVIRGFSTILSSYQSGIPSLSLAQILETYLCTSIPGLKRQGIICTANIEVVSKTSTLQVYLQYRTLTRTYVSTENTTWESVFDIARVPLLLATEMALRFSVGPNSASFQDFSLMGNAHSSDWMVPLLYGMQGGVVSKGDIDVFFNFPSRSSLNVSALVETELLPSSHPFNVSLDYNLGMSSTETTAVLEYKDASTLPTVGSDQVLNNIVDGPLQALSSIFDGPMSVLIPPLQKTLWPTDAFKVWLQDTRMWLQLPSADAYLLVVSDTITPSTLQLPLVVNITVNERNMTSCTMSSIDTKDIETITEGINTHLAGCGLSDLITAGVDTVNGSIGRIGLYATTRGIVWQVNVRTLSPECGQVDNPNSVCFNVSWYSQRVPLFGSWTDLSQSLSSYFGQNVFIEPNFTTIASDTLNLISEPLRRVYPSKLPAVFFRLSVTDSYINRGGSYIEISPAQGSTDGGPIALSIKNGVVLPKIDFSLQGDIGIVFGGPPLGGGMNITISTCVEEINQTVPDSPDNTFVVTIEAEKRSNNVTMKHMLVSQRITLTPGKVLLDAILEDLLPQIDETVRPLCSVSTIAGDPLFGTIKQSALNLNRYLGENGEWIIPLSLSFSESNMDGIWNAVNTPSTYRFLGSDIRMGTNAELTPSIPNGIVTGTIGAVEMKATKLGGKLKIGMQANMKDRLVRLPLVSSAASDREEFVKSMIGSVKLDNTLSISDLQFHLTEDVVIPAYSDTILSFVMKGDWILDSEQSFKDLIKDFKWNVDWKGTKDALYRGVQRTSSSSLCEWMHQVENISESLANAALANEMLPFSSKSFGDVWSDVMGKSFIDARVSVCDNTIPQTTVYFCQLLQQIFLQPVCSKTSDISGTQMKLVINVPSEERTIRDNFRFDVPLFFKEDKVPVGVGSSGDFSLNAEFESTLNLVADFAGNGLSLKVSPGTRFELATSFLADGRIGLYFGPLFLSFSQTHASLGSPAKFIVEMNEKNQLDWTLSGNAHFDAAVRVSRYQCLIGITINDLSDFLRRKSIPTPIVKNCGRGFVEEVWEEIWNMSIFEYFLDGNAFTNAFSGGVNSFIDRLFGRRGALGKFSVPLVDKLVGKVITKELQGIMGPDITADIIAGISQITTGILMEHSMGGFNSTFIDELVLKGITELLCRIFGKYLSSCPPVPNVNDPQYNWTLNFVKVISVKVPSLGFKLGKSGVAYLGLEDCTETLEIRFAFSLTLSYSRGKGVMVYFDQQPIYSATIQFSISETCRLVGTLGFLGAEVRATPTSGMKGYLEVYSDRIACGIEAELGGVILLGFAGKLVEKMMHMKDVLEALPHWKATAVMKWGWSLDNQDLTPSFTLSDGQICIGRVLTKLLGGIVKQAKKVTDPLDKYIGPNGMLVKKIHATKFIFGREMNAIELLKVVYDIKCEGACTWKGVAEFLEAIVQIIGLVNDLDMITGVDPSGCGVIKAFQDFYINFHEGKTFNFGPVPLPDIKFDVPTTPEQRRVVTKVWNSVTVTGKFAVRFDLFEADVGQQIMKLLLGQDIGLISLTFPTLTISTGASWHFPVWFVPRISLGISVSAGIKIDVDRIAYTSRGIRQAISTHSIGKLINGLGLPALNSDGSQHAVLSGFVRLQGSVEVSLFLITGGAYVFIQLDGSASLLNMNGEEIVYFDQLLWIIKQNHGNVFATLDLKGELRAGFGLYLRLCIRLIFKKKCKTLAKKEWSATIWKGEWKWKNVQPAISPDGQINMGQILSDNAHFGATEQQLLDQPNPLIRIYDGNTIDYYPPGTAPLSVMPPQTRIALRPSQQFSYYGPVTPKPFTYEIYQTRSVVVLPPSEQASLVIMQSFLPSLDTVIISPEGIRYNTNPGVVFAGACNQIKLDDPQIGTVVQVIGVRCNAEIVSTFLSNITFSGSTSVYGGHPVTITPDAYTIFVENQPTQLNISPSSITGDNGLFKAVIPADTCPNVIAATHPTVASSVVLTGTPRQRHLQVLGGDGWDLFTVTDISQFYGKTEIKGGHGVNTLNVTLITPQNVRLEAVISPFNVIQSLPSIHTITFTSIQRRGLIIHGAKNTQSEVTVIQPEDDALLQIWPIGADLGVLTERITGCEGQSEIRIFPSGTGLHSIVLGKNNVLSSFECTVRIDATQEANQQVEVILQASAETRNLIWNMQGGALTVTDRKGETGWFNLFFSGVNRIIVNFGKNGNSLQVRDVPSPTELLFSFPKDSLLLNQVRIWSSLYTILANGSFDAIIGPDTSSTSPLRPFDQIKGMVAVVGTGSNTNKLTIDSDTGPDATSQSYIMDDQCLDPADSDPSQLTRPTAWMCNLMKENGINTNCQRVCHMLYKENAFTLSLSTGHASDTFKGVNAKIPVYTDLSDGDDHLFWSSAFANLNHNAGVGWDTQVLQIPLRDIVLYLGEDRVPDSVTIWAGDMIPTPNMSNTYIAPLGKENGSVTLYERYREDLVYLRRGFPDKYITSSPSSSKDVYINITDPGVIVRWDLVDNTNYIITYMAAQSVIEFYGRGDSTPSKPLPPARGWHVISQLPEMDTSRMIQIYSVRGADGTFTVQLPSIHNQPRSTFIMRIEDPLNSKDQISTSSASGAISVGGLYVTVVDIDHLSVLSSYNAMNINIEGTPASCDLYIDVPSYSNITIHRISNNTLIVNGTVIIPSNVIQSNVSIVTTGSTAQVITDCSSSSSVSYNEGCLHINPTTFIGKVSNWLAQKASSIGVPTSAFECKLFTNAIYKLHVTASNVTARKVDKAISTYILNVTKGDLYLDDSDRHGPWMITSLQSSSIHVNNDFIVTISNNYKAVLVPSGFTNESILHIDCMFDVTSKAYETYWFIKGDDMSSTIEWFGSSCNGFIRPVNNIFPSIDIIGSSLINTTIVQYNDDNNNASVITTRDVSIASGSLAIFSQEQQDEEEEEVMTMKNDTMRPYLLLTWPLSPQTTFGLAILDGVNNITISDDLPRLSPLYFLKVDREASAVLSSGIPSSFLIQGRLRFVYEDRKLIATHRDSAHFFCLEPTVICTDTQWVDVAIRGEYPCLSPDQESSCQASFNLVLDTPLPFTCHPQENSNAWTIKIDPDIHDKMNSPPNPQLWIILYAMYGITVFVAILSWGIFRLMLDIGWGPFVFSAFLFKLNQGNEWDPYARELIDATRYAVGNLYGVIPPWMCDLEEAGITFVIWSFVALSGLAVIISIFRIALSYLIMHRPNPNSKSKDNAPSPSPPPHIVKISQFIAYLHRFAVACATFPLLPMVISILDSATSHPERFGFILVSISYLFLCFITEIYTLEVEIREKKKNEYGDSRSWKWDLTILGKQSTVLVIVVIFFFALFTSTSGYLDWYIYSVIANVCMSLLHLFNYATHVFMRNTSKKWSSYIINFILWAFTCGLGLAFINMRGSNIVSLILWSCWMAFYMLLKLYLLWPNVRRFLTKVRGARRPRPFRRLRQFIKTPSEDDDDEDDDDDDDDSSGEVSGDNEKEVLIGNSDREGSYIVINS